MGSDADDEAAAGAEAEAPLFEAAELDAPLEFLDTLYLDGILTTLRLARPTLDAYGVGRKETIHDKHSRILDESEVMR